MRRLLLHSRYPRSFQAGITASAAIAALALFSGPARAEDNAGIWLLWMAWWPAASLSFLAMGRIWCGVCPASLLADLLTTRFPYRRMAVPPALLLREIPILAGSLALFHFTGLWFDFEEQVRASGILLLLLAFAALLCTLAFRERLWCRALCPAGALGGFLSQLSPVRIEADRGACQTGCDAASCEVYCPTIDEPRSGVDPRECILCGNCLKKCPHIFDLRYATTPPPGRQKTECATAGLLLAGIGIDSALCHARDWPLIFWKIASTFGIAPDGRVELAVHAALVLLPLFTAYGLARATGPAASFRERYARFGSIGLHAAAATVAATALRALLVLAPRQLDGILGFPGEPWGDWFGMMRRLDGVPIRIAQGVVVIFAFVMAWRGLARANGTGRERATAAGAISERLWFFAIAAALLFLFSLPVLS